jgi:mycothiol synthase
MWNEYEVAMTQYPLTPPEFPGLTWRALEPEDLGLIAALAAACLEVDGGLPLAATEPFVRRRYMQESPRATIGAFDASGRLVASAAAQPAHTDDECRAAIVGQVHPEARGRGLGHFLMSWSVAQAGALLAGCPADRPRALHLLTEGLTAAAERLYARYGFAQQFAEDVMRRDLSEPLPEAPLPSEIALATWTPALAPRFFEAYDASFRDRPGFPGWSAERWIAWVAEDEEFRPELSLLATDPSLPLGAGGRRSVGFIVCSDEWIVQVGTRPEWRGRGLGSALVVEALRRWRAAGGQRMLLDVNANNPTAARVYARLGFAVIGRRARYVRGLVCSD